MPAAASGCPADPGALTQEIAELRTLLAWLDAQHQREHAALAAELHDQLGSTLTALAMRLAIVARQNSPGTTQWDKIQELLGQSVQTARRVQQQLRPFAVDVSDWTAALAEHVTQFCADHQLACTVEITGNAPQLPLATLHTLMQIVQQALDNTAQHARATRLQLQLGGTEQQYCVAISDNGIGFAVPAAGPVHGIGLRLLRERARRLPARCQIASQPGQGCRISLTLTLPLLSVP